MQYPWQRLKLRRCAPRITQVPGVDAKRRTACELRPRCRRTTTTTATFAARHPTGQLNFDNPNKRANEILKSVERRPRDNGEEIVGNLAQATVSKGRRYQHGMTATCPWLSLHFFLWSH